ncbi:helix-turn-helix domain-containing protein [Myceligenerans pegani]|uniref:Helix-turn-helix domain-containing protein n=1 Tax=Myceligenerans pegani TaxID=2776917 RepID=A0ABR9N556_9MICO|nr:helix-turn-helix transcriptional regulator [Myceligenerans sp. TRM 65318]MBE1878806.1 helix-turn-helix domain-containing protein [Myceligenerans sp. TRM 65318]MBE3021077.1 helix-turn-helix domain-containing protein [Myceligenerans sp. TRM 65318]
MSDAPNLLGEYLRARREQVSPERAGIPRAGVRRVPGLRREEVAMLAGISADYYLRLEQGRDRNPSVQVLESVARVLRLDDAGTAYLLGLAAQRPRRRRPRSRRETVPPGTLKLLGALGLPAFVEGRYFDVLAANSLATALSPRLRAGRNRLRDVFLDPAEQALYAHYAGREDIAGQLVAGFRASVGNETDDPRLVELVGELSLASPDFRKAWARHDVTTREGAVVSLDHPAVGRITLNREKLAIGGAPGLTLAVYHADTGSPDADKLQVLASYAASDHPEPRADTEHRAAPSDQPSPRE